MIKKIHNYFSHTDDRGSIRGIVNFNCWEEINHISSVKGTVRGGHFHQKTQELFIILKGKIEVTIQRINDDNPVGKEEKHIFSENDVFLIEPNVCHTFLCLEDSTWINVLSVKMDKNQPDFFKPKSPNHNN